MDALFGISNSKVPKRSSLSSINNYGPQNPYYNQSRAPILYGNTPVKVEEDVLVMDGILLKSSPVDRDSNRDRGSKEYKTDLCLSYLENSGFCRYGMKCQFAHGNKELRPSKLSSKTTLETPCKNYSISGSCSFGSKCRFVHHETSTPPSQTAATSAIQTISPIKLDEPATSTVNLKSTEWSPLDDDIEIQTATDHNTPSKEDVEALITKVLYGPRRIKRLPVFDQICPE